MRHFRKGPTGRDRLWNRGRNYFVMLSGITQNRGPVTPDPAPYGANVSLCAFDLIATWIQWWRLSSPAPL
jgi:hypothetical protein